MSRRHRIRKLKFRRKARTRGWQSLEQRLMLSTQNENEVKQVFLDLLNRPADSGGLAYWTDQLDAGADRGSIAQQLTHTSEYFSKIIIAPAYEKYLGRTPDAAGISFWVDQMQNDGLTDEHLEAGFIGSQEFYAHAGGTDTLWVDAMYQGLLGRPADADGESYWVQQLANGANRADVAYGFAASLEREAQRVDGDYEHFLRRPSDSSGVSYWVDQFAQGLTNEDLIAGFIASDEYYNLAQELQNQQPLYVTISSPASGLATNTNITVSGQLSGGQSQPPALAMSLDGGPATDVNYDSFGNFSVTTSLPLDGSGDGSHVLHFRASDSLGDPPGAADFDFMLDTVPPIISVTSPAQNATVGSNITLSGQVTDSASGVASFTAALDSAAPAPLTVNAQGAFNLPTSLALDGTADGPHVIHLKATDAAGNVSTSDFHFALQTTKPVITFTSSVSGLVTNSNVTLSGKVADGQQQITSLTYAVDAGSFSSVSIDSSGNFTLPPTTLALDGSADGQHTIHVKATDGRGQTTEADFNFTLATTPPVITVTSPAANTTTNSNITITGNVSDTESGLASLGAGVDTTKFTPVSTDAQGHFSYTTALTLRGTVDGAHTVFLQAVDKAGNVSNTKLDFVLDTTGPAVSINGVSSGLATNQNVTLSGQATDALSGVASLSEAVDAGAYGSVTLDALGNFTLPATSFALDGSVDGPHTIHVKAVDTLGNTTQVDFKLTLDTRPPVTPAFDLAQGTADLGPDDTSATRVTIVGTTDPGATVSLVGTSSSAQASGSGAFQIPGVSLSVGSNSLQVQATDAAGNTSSYTRTVTRSSSSGAPPNAVIVWNQATLAAIQADATDPLFASRGLAMVQAAVFDAVNAIEGTPAYYVKLSAPAGASVPAAVDAAAHDVLVYLYPDQQSTFDALLASQLALLPAGQATTDGQTVGQAAAAAIIAIRANDGSRNFVDFQPSSAPGNWQPTAPAYAPALDPQWANLTPFAITSPNQFDPAGPPALTSAAWAAAVNQVESLGAANSTTRTTDQTQIAQFWNDASGTYTPPGHWNAIAQTVAQQEGDSIVDDARLFAELDVSLADAGITAWNTKFDYNTWRPITVIQNPSAADNPAVTADPTWEPFLTTPNFPEYVSGHSTFSAAAATVLDAFFGDNVSFTSSEVTLPGVTRSYTSFDQAAQEAGMSRIYAGIHFEFSNADGAAAGTAVAGYVLNTFNIKADNTPPRIVLDTSGLTTDATPNEFASNKNITIAGQVTDNLSGAASLQAQVDNGGYNPVTFNATTGQFSVVTTLPLDGTADGVHTIDFEATDNAGNTSAPVALQFALGTKPPTINVSSPAGGSNLTTTSTASGAITTSSPALVALSYQFDSGPAIPISFTASSGAGQASTYTFSNQQLNLAQLAAGSHTLSFTATDAAGNTNTQSVQVSLASAIPLTITGVDPMMGATNVSVTFRPNVTFSRPVNPSTLTNADFHVSGPDGTPLPATIVPAADGMSAMLFITNPMPGASVVTLTIDGSQIKAADGTLLDAADSGTPGSVLHSTFTTVSETAVPGTTLTGIIADTGPDLIPDTRDNVLPGPDHVLGTADDVYSRPIQGVQVYIIGQQNQAVTTDAQGRFTLANVPAGDVKLVIEGNGNGVMTYDPTSQQFVDPRANGYFFPEMVMDLSIRPGATNTVMGSMGTIAQQEANTNNLGVFLPRLQTSILHNAGGNTAVTIPLQPSSSQGLTPQQAASYSITVAPNSLIGFDGKPLGGGQVGFSTVSQSLVRDMLPQGVTQLSSTLTIQAPNVAAFNPPLQLTFANIYGAAPGSKLDVYSFNHTTGMLEVTGTATVSADGKTATTDPGSGISHPGWFGTTPPASTSQQCEAPTTPDSTQTPTLQIDEVVNGTDVSSTTSSGQASGQTAPQDASPSGLKDQLFFSDSDTFQLQLALSDAGQVQVNGANCGNVDSPTTKVGFNFDYTTAPDQSPVFTFDPFAGSAYQVVLSNDKPTDTYNVPLNEVFTLPKLATATQDTLYGAILKITPYLLKDGQPAMALPAKTINLYRFFNIADIQNVDAPQSPTSSPDVTSFVHTPDEMDFPRTFADPSGAVKQELAFGLDVPPAIAGSVNIVFENLSGTSPFTLGTATTEDTVTFKPTSPDNYFDNLKFTDANGLDKSLKVVGQGVGPQLVLFSETTLENDIRQLVNDKPPVPGTEQFVSLFPSDPAGLHTAVSKLYDNIVTNMRTSFHQVDPQLVHDVTMTSPNDAIQILDQATGNGDVINMQNVIDQIKVSIPMAAYTSAPVNPTSLTTSADAVTMVVQTDALTGSPNVHVQMQISEDNGKSWSAVGQPIVVNKAYDFVSESVNLVGESIIDGPYSVRAVATPDNGDQLNYQVTLTAASNNKNGLREGSGAEVEGAGVEDFQSVPFKNLLAIQSNSSRLQKELLFAGDINRSATDPPADPNSPTAFAGTNIDVDLLAQEFPFNLTSIAFQFGNILAHEVGHNLGAIHIRDANAPYAGTTIMGQGGVKSDGVASYGDQMSPVVKMALGLPVLGSSFDPQFDSAYGYYSGPLGRKELGINVAPLVDPEAGPNSPVAELWDAPVTAGGPVPNQVTTVDLGSTIADGPGGNLTTKTVYLYNAGDQPLDVSNIQIFGSTAFSITGVGAVPLVLPPGDLSNNTPEQCTQAITIQFDPMKAGAATATLEIDSDTLGGQPFEIPLSGKAIAATGAIQVAAANNNLGGMLLTGSPLTVQNFATVSNDGSQPLTISNVVIPNDTGTFSFSGLPAGFGPGQPLVLQPGGSIPLAVTFQAQNLGLQRGEIDIYSNDPNQPVYRLHVVGTGMSGTASTIHWGDDFVAVKVAGQTLRTRSSDSGSFSFSLPPNALYTLSIFDPISGLIYNSQGTTAASGETTNFGYPAFAASTAPDTDGDGLPDDVEFAIGTSPTNAFTAGDGIDDFTHVITDHTDPLDGRGFPTGVIASLALAGTAEGIAVQGSTINSRQQTAYIATGTGLAVVDATQFNKPVLLGQVALPGDNQDVAVDPAGQIAAVAAGSSGLNLVNVSNPQQPVLTQTVALDNPGIAVTIVDGLAIVAEGGDLVSIDTATGAIVQTLALNGGVLTGLARDGTELVTMDAGNRLQVVDVDDGLMVARGSLTLSQGTGKIFTGNGIVYVAAANNSQGGFIAVDISNPDSPKLDSTSIGSVPEPATAFAANGSGLGVEVGRTGSGDVLDLFAIADPTKAGQFVTSVPLAGAAKAVAIASGIAYVADGSGGLEVVNYEPFDTAGVPPTVSISTSITDADPSTSGFQVAGGTEVPILVQAHDDVQVSHVELLVNGQVVANQVSFPFDLSTIIPNPTPQTSTFNIQVQATDTGGNVSLSNVLPLISIPDTLPATILHTTPAEGATVPISQSTAEIDFSKALTANTVTTANFQIVDSKGHVVPLTNLGLRNGDRTVQLVFDQLAAGNYQIVINAAAVTDRAGVALGAANIVSHFTVISHTINWTGAAGDGDWDTAANWDLNRVPTTGDDVVINVPGNVTVTLPMYANTSIDTLVCADNLVIEAARASATLTIAGKSEIDGSFSFDGADLVSLQVNGVLTLKGTTTWQNSEISGNGGVLNEGTLNLSGSDGETLATTLSNSGTIIHQGVSGGFVNGGALYVNAGATIDNLAGGVYEFVDDYAAIDSNSGNNTLTGSFENEGTVRKSSGTGTNIVQVESFVNNGGGFDIQSGIVALVATISNPGNTFVVTGAGSLALATDSNGNSSSTLTGTYNGSGGGHVFLGDPNAGGEIVLGAAGATLNFAAGMLTANSTIDATAGALVNKGALTFNGASMFGELDNFGTVLVSGGLTVSFLGSLTVINETTGDFKLQGNSASTGFTTFNNQGSLEFGTATASAQINFGGTTFDNSGSFTVDTGHVQLSANLSTTNTNFDVNSGATLYLYNDINYLPGQTISGSYSGSGGGQVLIEANLVAGSGGATFNFPSGMLSWNFGTLDGGTAGFTNSGYLHVAGHTNFDGNPVLFLSGHFTNSGTMTHTGSGPLLFNAGSTLVNQVGAVYDFQDDLAVIQAANNNTNSTFSNQGTVMKSQGPGSSDYSVGATFSPAIFDNSGTVEVESGALHIGSTVSQVSNGTLSGGTWIVINNSNAEIDLYNAGSLTANGATISLSDNGARFPAINGLMSSSGSFSVLAGATFSTAGNLSNSGTIVVGPGSTLTVNGVYTQTASGMLTVQIGGTAASGQFGQLAVTGGAVLDGTLTLQLVNTFSPNLGESYNVVSYASQSGTFATIVGLTIGSGKAFKPTYNPTDFNVAVVTA